MFNDEIDNLKQILLDHSSIDEAKKMSEYMLNQFKFLGVRADVRRVIAKEFITKSKNLPVHELIEIANILWQEQYREFQYIAIDLLAKYVKKITVDNIHDLLSLLTNRSWWDSVDGLISVINKALRLAIKSDKDKVLTIIEENRNSDNIWLVRMTLLHQNGWKEHTNSQLLFSLALQHASSGEFFVRKAIGWALRDYAKHEPNLVYNFLDEHKERFSGLTYREATKHRNK